MKEVIDQEWVDLIWEAKESGLSLEEVKTFFTQHRMGKEADTQSVIGWETRDTV